MEYHDPDQRWWQRGWVRAAALVVVAAVVSGTVVGLWVGGAGSTDDRDDPNDSTPSSEQATASTSACGLPDGEPTIPSTAPETEWETVDQVAIPVSPEQYGPGTETDGGVYTCFAHNPTGAVMAAGAALAQQGSSSIDQIEYAEERYAHEGYYERAIQRLQESPPSEDDRLTGAIAGFRVLSYSEKRSVVEVAAEIEDSEFEGDFLVARLTLKWRDGDWRIVVPEDVTDQLALREDLEGFTRFSAPSAAEQRTPHSPARARIAPAWSFSSSSGEAPAAGDEQPCDELASLSCVGDIAKKGAALSPLAAAGGAAADAAGGAVNSAAESAAGSAFENIAEAMIDAQEWAIKELLTAWLSYPNPDLTGSDSAMVWLQDNLHVLVVFTTIGACLLAAYRLATTGRFEHLGDLGMVFARVILTGGLVGTLVTLGLQVGDLYADWVMRQVDVDVAGMIELLVLSPGHPAWILLFAGAFVVLVQIFQFAIMIIRYGAVVLLSATLVLFAAGSNSQIGKQGWQKQIAWLVAFVLYKPVAATIYALALMLASGDTVADTVAGIAMTLLALVALPAMMRLVAPQTAALGGANAGSMAGAATGAAVAGGAVLATGGAAAGAGGFAGGFSGSSAATTTSTTAAATGGTPGGGATAAMGPSGAAASGGSTVTAERAGQTVTGTQGGSGGGAGAESAPRGGESPRGVDPGDVARGMGQGSSMGGRATGAAEDSTEGDDK